MKILFKTKKNTNGNSYYILMDDSNKTYKRGYNYQSMYDLKVEVNKSYRDEIEKELLKNNYVREEV